MAMSARSVNEIHVRDKYNRMLRYNLGKRYTDKEFIDILRGCGFLYPDLCIKVLLSKGYISKKKVANKTLISFENIDISSMEVNNILYCVRQRRSAYANKHIEPLKYLSLNELLDSIRVLFEDQGIIRFGVLSDETPDIKQLIKVLNLRGQKVSYHDIM